MGNSVEDQPLAYGVPSRSEAGILEKKEARIHPAGDYNGVYFTYITETR
jgi:hypothetical protein